MNIEKNIERFQTQLEGKNCRLVAVSKTKPEEDILVAYNAGMKVFGENKAQELARKYENLPKDIEWHMIGHMQTNKVKYIAPFVHLIHGVDTLKLLKEINKQGAKLNRVINCLLQIHIAEEETKFGFAKDEVIELLNGDELCMLDHIKIIGLMGMATYTEDGNQIRKEFKSLRNLFDEISKHTTPPNVIIKELSMGMSGDYQIAIEEGSTLIRVGSAIFGARNYN